MNKEFQKKLLKESYEALNWDIQTTEALENLAIQVLSAIKHKKIVFAFGNGGSASEADHFIGEFTSACKIPHEPWRGVSLSSNSATFTSIANDFGFENTYSRQIEAQVNPGDIVIALSTSGESSNIKKALYLAAEITPGNVYLLTSIKYSNVKPVANVNIIRVPSRITSRIQEMHLLWLHGIIEYCEQEMTN